MYCWIVSHVHLHPYPFLLYEPCFVIRATALYSTKHRQKQEGAWEIRSSPCTKCIRCFIHGIRLVIFVLSLSLFKLYFNNNFNFNSKMFDSPFLYLKICHRKKYFIEPLYPCIFFEGFMNVIIILFVVFNDAA